MDQLAVVCVICVIWRFQLRIFHQQLAHVKDEVRQREDTIKEKQQFLDSVIETNREQEKKISLAERSAAKMRLDHQEAEAQMDQFRSEVLFHFHNLDKF